MGIDIISVFNPPKPEEIKPCPFCGGNPTYINNFLELDLHVIYCENKECKVHPHTIGKTKEEARERWNHRV